MMVDDPERKDVIRGSVAGREIRILRWRAYPWGNLLRGDFGMWGKPMSREDWNQETSSVR